MCGIAGCLDNDLGRGWRRVEQLNLSQEHRGPDHTALVQVDRATLGNTRLAILDPTPAGNQPFTSPDGTVVCVFNGEIYNYIELINRYDLKPSDCDGAVIPQLWQELGIQALSELRGMFAIAIYEVDAKRLILARDTFGIKPLFHRPMGDTVVFASEPRPLARLSPKASIDPAAVTAYLHLGAIPDRMSPFKGIEPVPANAAVIYDRSLVPREVEIAPGLPAMLKTDGTAPRQDLGEVFRESVKLHLRADVKTSLLLSGGFDSAALAAVARELGHDLQCVTVAAVGGTDESAAAARTAGRYGHPHTVVNGEVTPELLESFFARMQRPTIDGLNTAIVSRAISNLGVKVALSGLGGDEALGGYSHFKLLRLLPGLAAFDRLPIRGRKILLTLGSRWLGGLADKRLRFIQQGARTPWGLGLTQREVTAPATVTELTARDPLELDYAKPSPEVGWLSPFSQLVVAESMLYLTPTLLSDTDTFSMAASVEVRVPFVDRSVFQATNNLASGTGGFQHKSALASALNDEYLLHLTEGDKKGFTVPVEQWLRSGALAAWTEPLNESSALIWRHLDERHGRTILKTSNRWSVAWALIVLQSWLSSVEAEGVID